MGGGDRWGRGGVSPELQGFFFVLFSIKNAPSYSLTASRSNTAPPSLCVVSPLSCIILILFFFKNVLSSALPPSPVSSSSSSSPLIIANNRRHSGNKQLKVHWNCLRSATRREASLTAEAVRSAGTPCCVSHYSSFFLFSLPGSIPFQNTVNKSLRFLGRRKISRFLQSCTVFSISVEILVNRLKQNRI